MWYGNATALLRQCHEWLRYRYIITIGHGVLLIRGYYDYTTASLNDVPRCPYVLRCAYDLCNAMKIEIRWVVAYCRYNSPYNSVSFSIMYNNLDYMQVLLWWRRKICWLLLLWLSVIEASVDVKGKGKKKFGLNHRYMSACSILVFEVDIDHIVAGHIQWLVERVCNSLNLAVYRAISGDKLESVAGRIWKLMLMVNPRWCWRYLVRQSNIGVKQPLVIHSKVKRQFRFNLNQPSGQIGEKVVDNIFLFWFGLYHRLAFLRGFVCPL